MPSNLYAARSDLYTYGLARGTLGMPARLVASSLAATDTIELDGHGFETNDALIFRATEGGTLSAPLVAGVTYYAISLNDSTFQVATAPNGPPINLTSDGVSMVVAAPLPFDQVIEFYSRWADGFMPAEVVPLVAPIPVIVAGVVAQLAAKKLAQLAGHSAESLDAYEMAAKAQLERWSKGVPLRDPNQSPGNNAVVSSLVVTGTDSRGWGSTSLP